ncbi:MAG: MFS transporter [Hyphomicrobiales bacterium]
MTSSVRSLWALLIGVGMLALGNGLQGTLLGVRATEVDFGATLTGYVMSGYFIGALIGSIITPRLIGEVGHIRVFAAFASIVSTAALLYAVFVNPYAWFIFRVMTGLCIAGLYIVCESWLNSISTTEDRGKILSIYMTITFSAMGCGQFLLNVAAPGGFILFILVSVLVSVSLVPMTLVKSKTPEFDKPRPVAIVDIYKSSPLAVTGCVLNGLGQSAFFSLGAVYGAKIGMSIAQVSWLMAVPMLGVIVSQYPIGMISDRYDRRWVMIVISALTALVAAACLFQEQYSVFVMIGLFGVFGALSLPLYSLALAHANDYLEYDQMLGAAGKLVLLFGIGATIGPMVAGQMIDVFGSQGFFIFMIAVYGLIATFALYRTTRRAPVPLDEQGDFMLVSPRTTPLAAAVLADEAADESKPEEQEPAAT